jgi:hypothetical protein
MQFSEGFVRRKMGIVEKIEYTHGGFGNQYTTIDGKEYITYWDFAEGVDVGAKVEFTEQEDGVITFGNLSLHGPKANDIKVIALAKR